LRRRSDADNVIAVGDVHARLNAHCDAITAKLAAIEKQQNA